jgi:hypothetical protein
MAKTLVLAEVILDANLMFLDQGIADADNRGD